MRKGFLLLLGVGGLGFAATYLYLQRTPSPPPPPPAPPIQARPSPIAKTTSSPIAKNTSSPVAKTTPRPGNLAPDGTYFLLRYHSVTTDTGVIGFAPGTKVSMVRKSGQTIRVTDGQVEFDMSAGEVTNNKDIAARVARTDSRTQQQATALASAQSNSLWIVQASWDSPGGTIVDVTTEIKRRVASGDRTITASSIPGGNSTSRATKTLVITYVVGGGAPITEAAQQGGSIKLPSVPLAGK